MYASSVGESAWSFGMAINRPPKKHPEQTSDASAHKCCLPTPIERERGTKAGAKIAPMFAPELKTPVASPLFLGEPIGDGFDRSWKISRFSDAQSEPYNAN